MPALHEHATMLSRNLLYTAISRAKKLLVIVGSPRAIERLHRLTRLTHLISTDTYAVREIDVDELVAAAE
ncbi:hypothetical protein T492DRAFT_862911 [Pavlovales sp. CCMP2436]|nr:hypothetical protein T492DRAFT_862911 [Pavlovales sp. CCMP2436]